MFTDESVRKQLRRKRQLFGSRTQTDFATPFMKQLPDTAEDPNFHRKAATE